MRAPQLGRIGILAELIASPDAIIETRNSLPLSREAFLFIERVLLFSPRKC